MEFTLDRKTLVHHIDSSNSTQIEQLVGTRFHLKFGLSDCKCFVNRFGHAQPSVITDDPGSSLTWRIPNEVSSITSLADCEVRARCCFPSFLRYQLNWVLFQSGAGPDVSPGGCAG